MKHARIADLFTPAELSRAIKAYQAHKAKPDSGSFAKLYLLPEIVVPAMQRINEVSGQENDPMYMAYALEAALMQASR